MAQSQVNLYNLAISAVGAKYTLTTTSDNVLPADLCNLWYENVRQTMLRAAHWNCAKQFLRLVEVTERNDAVDWATTDPAPGYAFSYAIPTSMLAARYLTTFDQFELHYDAGNSKMVLNTNLGSDTVTETPILCYTIDVTDVTRWEPDLYQAMIYALAAHICMPLTGKIVRAREMLAAADGFILQARANTANEMHQRRQQIPRELQARGYGYAVSAPYVYPYGSTFTGTGAPLL